MTSVLLNRLGFLNVGRVVRGFHSTLSVRAAYESDGKTTATVLNKDLSIGLMVNSFSQFGFTLNNGTTILGPMVIFPRSVLSWTIGRPDEINEKSLSLFTVLEPKLDILVLGYGDAEFDHRKVFSKDVVGYMRKHKINIEMLPTEHACSTFNFLNAEGRFVAAAMIPPRHLRLTDDDVVGSQIKRLQDSSA